MIIIMCVVDKCHVVLFLGGGRFRTLWTSCEVDWCIHSFASVVTECVRM